MYVNNTLNAAVEIPTYFIVTITMDRLGRKPLLAGALGIAGVSCLVCIFVKVYAPRSVTGEY